jgi:hypothetical protein
MAEENKEPVKKPTQRKTQSKPKVEEPTVDMNAMALQMQQMMQLMAQQQEMIMKLQQQNQQKEEIEEVVEEPKKESKVRKATQEDRGLTKQGLRRKYKNTDIYLTSVFHGSISFNGRNDSYSWSSYGDVQPVTVADLLEMSRFPKYLETPWLVLDDYENNEEVLEDVIACLGLEKMYRRLYILQELEENINKVDMEELAQILKETPSLKIDVCTIAQNKIQSGELENYRLISEFEKLTGRMLNK